MFDAKDRESPTCAQSINLGSFHLPVSKSIVNSRDVASSGARLGAAAMGLEVAVTSPVS